MKIAVVGAGAMGTLFGGRLARAGNDVVMIDADPERVAAINIDGLVENDLIGKVARVPAALAEETRFAADLILIFTKSLHTASAMAQAAHLLAPGGTVLTLQNGLGNDAAVAGVIGADRVLVGMTTWPADLVGHGRVHVPGEGAVKIWSMTGEHRAAIDLVSSTLNIAALRCSVDADVIAAIWQKVIFNSAMNGVAALTGMTVGLMADFLPARDLIERVVSEGISIARGVGIAVDAASLRSTIADALAQHRGHKPSMLQDVEAGRPTEVDAILGALVAHAASCGVDAPHLLTCASLIRSIDNRSQGKRNNS